MVFTSGPIARWFKKVGHVITRTKTEEEKESKLARVLRLFDLIFLGVGSTLGVGVYVLAGTVALESAGPAVVLSFMVAAIASVMAALCYAEFAARVPRAGSAYIYSYVTVGELAAFIIGWNLILEYVIGTASVARAFSNYVDSISNKVMSTKLNETMHIPVSFLSPYPDFLSLGMVALITALLAYGVQASAMMNNIFTSVNLITICLVIVAGLTKINFRNWNIPASEVPKTGGAGGFIPFGVSGVMAGAAKCFFAFVGFDCIATTGEEAKKPHRNIPLGIMISLLIVFLAYFGISAVLTLMLPYYEQDKNAPLVYVFQKTNLSIIGHIVTVGAIFALCTSLIGSLFPIPRMFYSMAKDGLLFKPFAIVNQKSKIPHISTYFSGTLSGLMAAFFQLDQLVDMMSIGTLLAYTVVSLCVLILRFRNSNQEVSLTEEKHARDRKNVTQMLFNTTRAKQPSKLSTFYSEIVIGIFVILVMISTVLMVIFEEQLEKGNWISWTIVGISYLFLIFTVILLALHPKDVPDIYFKVPLMPYIPCFSIFVNIYLMMKLDIFTWIRFSVWLILGAIIYLAYSITHSVEGKKRKELAAQENIPSK